MSKLYVLGDSWSWGWNSPHLKTGAFRSFRKNMCTVLAEGLGLELINDSQPGNSFPQITQHFFRRVSQHLTPTDVVFICVPPDIRWHRAIPPGFNSDKSVRWAQDADADEDTTSTLFGSDGCMFDERIVSAGKPFDPEALGTLELALMQNNFNMYWFKYHTSMQLTALSTWAKVNNANVFAQHNYGTLDNLCDFTDASIVLDPAHSMWEWMGLPKHEMLDDSKQDGPNANVIDNLENASMKENYPLMYEKLLVDPSGGLDWHPNKQSQLEIGNKLYELCNQRMG